MRCKLSQAKIMYDTAVERVKMFEDDESPLNNVDNHYLRRLNQNVCKAMKKRYKDATKEYQKFLREIKL